MYGNGTLKVGYFAGLITPLWLALMLLRRPG